MGSLILPPLKANPTDLELIAWLSAACGVEAMRAFYPVWLRRVRDHREKVQQACANLVARMSRSDLPRLQNPGAWANQQYQAICNGEAKHQTGGRR